MSAHAKLSPSSAERWMTCPGSLVLCAGLPDTSSSFADEGTLAHAFAAMCLETGKNADHFAFGYEFSYDDHGVAKSALIDGDMRTHVQTYVDLVRALSAQGELMVEQRLPIDHLTAEADAHGTADTVILLGTELIVIDLKYGRGVRVDAEENAQLQIYALAALNQFSLAADFERVRMIIAQPRLGHVSEWVQSVADLEAFGEAVKMKAQWAHACVTLGLDEVEDLMPSEKGCRFCKAKATCPALRQRVLDTVADDFVDTGKPIAPQLADSRALLEASDNAHLGECLSLVDLIEGWCKAVRAKAEAELFAGKPVPGFKLVEGRRGARKWSDPAEAEEALKRMKVKHDQMYDYSVISPTSAEKLAKAGEIGPRQWPQLQTLITQPEGKPSVAPLSDKRPAIDVAATSDDFAVITSTATA